MEIEKETVCSFSLAEQFLKHHLVYLSLFEKEMMANMLREVKENFMQSMENKFNILQTR